MCATTRRLSVITHWIRIDNVRVQYDDAIISHNINIIRNTYITNVFSLYKNEKQSSPSLSLVHVEDA